MKQILFFFFLFFSLFAGAQMSDSIGAKEATLKFKGKYHGIIYALMPDKGSSDAINYVNQVRAQAGEVFDTSQLFTVTISYRMVINTVNNLGSQQERLTSQDNAELQKQLTEQLMVPAYQDLLQFIGETIARNKEETEALRQSGIEQIMKVDPFPATQSSSWKSKILEAYISYMTSPPACTSGLKYDAEAVGIVINNKANRRKDVPSLQSLCEAGSTTNLIIVPGGKMLHNPLYGNGRLGYMTPEGELKRVTKETKP